MTDNIDKISAELRELGFSTTISESPRGPLVSFEYRVDVGSFEGKPVLIGLSMQGKEMYPEYPPHWLHLSPPIDDRRGGVVEQYTDPSGRSWTALSRPPGVIWDRLLTKHISGYLSDHLRRFWHDI